MALLAGTIQARIEASTKTAEMMLNTPTSLMLLCVHLCTESLRPMLRPMPRMRPTPVVQAMEVRVRTRTLRRGAHSQFLLAGCASGEHEDRDVAAADEKQQGDGSEEQEERAFELAEQRVVEGFDFDLIAFVGEHLGMIVSDLADEAVQLSGH